MFVSDSAKETIIKKRKNQTLKRLVRELVLEANQLKISETELIEMIQVTNKEEGGQ